MAPGRGLYPEHLEVVERVVGVIREQDGLSLTEMADVAHFSPYHFARTFRRVTGIPPGEFVAALRLERAKRLLLTTDLSVGEICFEVGYKSVGSFTSRFTQLVGLSPTRMRRLPGRLETIHERVLELDLPGTDDPRSPATAGVHGRIQAPGLPRALIFAGLFPGAIPQRGPVAGVMLTSPSDFVIPAVSDGLYQLMAAAVPLFSGPQSLLLPGEELRVGRAERPILMSDGATAGRVIVKMRPLHPTDPPILTPLAMLLLRQMESVEPEPLKRAR